MGNRMTVTQPYIIDEYPSDDDDEDDDDYFSYETAYETEGGEQNLDEEDGEDKWNTDKTEDNVDNGQQVSVNTQVVSSLVKEVETLLNYLDNEDYESAQKAARILKGGGEGEQGNVPPREGSIDESKPLLSDTERVSNEYSKCKQHDGHDTISRNCFGEEGVPLLSQDEEITASKHNDDWTTAQRRVFQQLDRDLTSFEENESRVVSDSAEETGTDAKPRRRRKSSLPRLKRGAFLNSNGSDGGSGGIAPAAGNRQQSRSRDSSLTRSSASPRLPRSPASCIPRFCYKVSSTKSASSVTTAAALSSGAGVGRGGSSVPVSSSVGGKKPVDEAITSCVKGFTSEAIPDLNENFRGNPIKYAARMGLSSEDKKDVMGESDRVQAWEINISDLTGRAKRNKKRSGIPSLWTHNKIHTPPSPSPSISSGNTVDSLNISPSMETVRAFAVNSGTQTVESSQSQITDIFNPAVLVNNVGWDMNQRKVFDQRRWNCISRPQYKTSCGISSVVSCWNFLFSTLGHGHLRPLSQEDAMNLLGFDSPYENIKFGPTTGNLTLMRWFRQLNNHFKVSGRCYFMYKPRGRNRTSGVTSEMALEKLKSGLRDKHSTFIYHCHNHYFCPIGFEESPIYPLDAYNEKISDDSIDKNWILIGDTSKKYGPFHCKSWDEICLDLNCENPEYYNIRQSWNGMMKRQKNNKVGGNLHCIMCFQSPQLMQNNQNQHNLSSVILQPPFLLHPLPPPPSLNSSQDGDGGSDCNDKIDGLMPHNDYSYPFDDGVGSIKMEEEEEEIESDSSEDHEDDDSSNYDADSLT